MDGVWRETSTGILDACQRCIGRIDARRGIGPLLARSYGDAIALGVIQAVTGRA